MAEQHKAGDEGDASHEHGLSAELLGIWHNLVVPSFGFLLVKGLTWVFFWWWADAPAWVTSPIHWTENVIILVYFIAFHLREVIKNIRRLFQAKR